MSGMIKRQDEILKSVDLYRKGRINRRELLKTIITVTGSYKAAHLFLESSGLAATLISQVEAQAANVAAETVHFPSGQLQMDGYLVKPKGPGRHSAVVVIHENRGLNEHIRDVARRLAAEGFAALAPDLLSRSGGTASMKTEEDAIEAIGMLPIYEVIDDLRAAFMFLAQLPRIHSEKISSIGFCWGGWRSFMLATVEPNLYRAVVFYGSSPESGFENIQAPVLAHYAQWDTRITGNALWTQKMMRQAGKEYQYHVYPESNHAFFNDTGTRHNPEASRLAWTRTLEFLRR
jgi:carboxymethylenebutenolidase